MVALSGGHRWWQGLDDGGPVPPVPPVVVCLFFSGSSSLLRFTDPCILSSPARSSSLRNGRSKQLFRDRVPAKPPAATLLATTTTHSFWPGLLPSLPSA